VADQALEADIVDGVEDAADHPERPVHTHLEYGRPDDLPPIDGSDELEGQVDASPGRRSREIACRRSARYRKSTGQLSRIANAQTALGQLSHPGNEMPGRAFPSLNL
jgi:hypothetical protein